MASRSWRRWVPAALVPAVIGAGAVVVAAQAGAAVDLPDRTAEEVLALVGSSEAAAFSGVVEQSAQLGLPELPGAVPSGGPAGSGLDLLVGSHTARVYVDGPTRARVQVMDRLAERDLVRNGTDVWFYTSTENTVTHLTLPEEPAGLERGEWADSLTPLALAERLISAADPTTEVTVDQEAEVAGRPAYEMVLTPRSSDTPVSSIAIAVDGETGIPLAVEIVARGQAEPAFRQAFTSIDLNTPGADRFEFVPPPGASVEERSLGDGSLATSPWAGGAPPTGSLPTGPLPTVTGTGWDAVVEIPAGVRLGGAATAPLVAEAVPEEFTSAAPGGRLLSSALLNVLFTDDGRVLAGAVTAERLQAVATGP